MGDLQTQLESEYCPPVDQALFFAIVSDFDLNNDDAIAEARATLDAIKAAATEQDTEDFDPSGAGSHADCLESEVPARHVESSSETGVSRSDETDLTSFSGSMRAIDIASTADGNDSYAAEAEKLDDTSKGALLKEMFPSLTDFTISHTLKKCRANWNRTLEELLNRTFFDEQERLSGEERIATKGVEAFSEDNMVRRGRFKRYRPQETVERVERATRSSSVPAKQIPSLWEQATADVNFLQSRTKVPINTISSVYHSNGASLSATIISLSESSSTAQADIASSKAAIQANTAALSNEFPTLDPKHGEGIVRLTHPSTAAAHELAKVLVHHSQGKRSGGIEIVPRYAPIDVDRSEDGNEDAWTTSREPRKALSGMSTPLASSSDPNALASSLLKLQQHSFAQASAAYRRGKSDHLMSAAAAYYSQQGRDFGRQRAEATAEAADALVDSQSTDYEIDLHGVSVKDGVRIARDRTGSWWQHRRGKVMGFDGRVRSEGDSGRPLRIVAGVGRHSAGGRARIGPAVGRMLFAEGWSFTIGDGVLTVYGKK